MKNLKYIGIGLAIVLSLGLSGCGSSGGGSDSPDVEDDAIAFSGTVQKGPFEAGTSITVYELDTNLLQTGKSHRTNTKDDKGNYDLPATLTSQYVEVFANGYYYDEITGSKSAATYELSVITDITGNNKVNVNILTSMAKDRVRELVARGSTFTQATAQSTTEVLKVFNLDDLNVSLEDMDLTETTASGTVLLSASSIVMQAAHDADANAISAELTSLLTNIKTELSTNDGNVSSATVINAIKNASINLDIQAVKTNLQVKFSVATLGDMENYIDGDGDGLMGDDEKVPTVVNVIIGTPENTTYNGILSGTDGDGDALTFTAVTSTIHGILSLDNNGTYTYAPSNGYIGEDSFTFKAFDGTTYSNVSTVTIYVNNSPIFTSENNVTILDNTTDIITVVAIDETAITYSMLGVDADKFDLNVSTGVLALKALLDWDNPTDTNTDNLYELSIKATDTLNNETIQNLIVKVKKYRLLGSYTMENNATVSDILVDGNYAYVTDLYNGLYIFDVSDSSNITLQSFTEGTAFRTIQKVGNILYIVASDGLKVIDASNTTSPLITYTLSNTVKTSNSGFHTENNTLFAIDTNYDLKIFDITNLSSINTLSTLDVTENINNMNQLVYNNNYVFFAGLGKIETIDVSDVNNPLIVDTYTTNGVSESVNSLLFSSDRLYSLTMYKLDIIDSINPTNLSRLGELDFSQKTYRFQNNMAINTNYIFTVAGNGVNGGINVVDKNIISTPSLVEEVDLEATPGQIDVNGDNAYISMNQKFIILDISDYN